MSRFEICIGGRRIGARQPPFIIAEMSGNHNQSLERALAIVDAVATTGADALKLQTYTADTMTIDHDGPGFRIDDPSSLWYGRTLHDLYRQAHTPWAWHRAIFERCSQHGLICFSSPFDASAVEFLEGLGAPCYKIASFENVDTPLIECAARTGKPLIISTGMAAVEEIERAVQAAHGAGCSELLLLKCTSSYPAAASESNLTTIPDMSRRFGCPVGLSDHTPGIGAAVAAVALGAVAIEKHVTLARIDGGVDAAFSLEPAELARLVHETGSAQAALGAVHYGPTASERGSLGLRRSLYVVEDIAAGEIITPRHIRAIRPGFGLAPGLRDRIVGQRAARDAPRGTPVDWTLIGGSESG